MASSTADAVSSDQIVCRCLRVTESEEHVDWLETQLSIIGAIGLQNYLSEQLGGPDEDEQE